MFSALGLFKNIPCPRQYDCGLPSCIFSHSPPAISPEAHDSLESAQEYDPFSAGEISPPIPKRRRLGSAQQYCESEDVAPLISSPPNCRDPRPSAQRGAPESKTAGSPLKGGKTSTQPPRSSGHMQKKEMPTSITRAVSPPPTQESNLTVLHSTRKPVKVESLIPRNVAKAPAVLKMRLAVLQKLHDQMQVQNRKLAEGDEKWRSMVLNDQELITFALDEEEAATKLGENIYKNSMTQKVLRIKKITTEEWIKTVTEWTGTASRVQAEEKSTAKPPDAIAAGFSSVSEQIAVLKHLRTPLEGMERFGYVTSKPTASEVASARAAVAAAAGYENCDRCGTRFQVFPGRDENGRLASHGKCRYHWARPNRTARLRTDRILGQSAAMFPCCNQLEGSEGCVEADTHVFCVKDPKRLADVLQFEHTPAKSDVRGRPPVSFDCEMAYTTLGMEVIRVTAVSWPQGRLLFDVLVRPYGEILDLNTRFSGVTVESYANALPYSPPSTEAGHVSTTGSRLDIGQQPRVGSPAMARQLLFDHLSPDTPLIGHAIENDLNVCRVIHPFVIDTVLLYPHPRGLPIRYGLKALSQQYLSRGIQTGGEAGHDSKEDAVATADLVSVKVAQKWRMMQHEGWKFVEGMLMSPEETEGEEGGGHSML
ncbi:uncharacterized protein Z518_05972 [Rhinocladiella mackenziei CBS 650.93]|uniref:Exonuclease domain-containing protein n=1 Tax=Rhinocladiella mackenziei CBS 650.93 TaxID=1442369 RepID=A0A0D2J7T6_9EURO|nr:uncharacterized protein Z518_05972 [Rhinocladiella mackenziei CBS 650.93]KIX05100.1 hypothetical protein Z518_05972 [Rhinocladiella mackenziei CBS 650.93]